MQQFKDEKAHWLKIGALNKASTNIKLVCPRLSRFLHCEYTHAGEFYRRVERRLAE